MHHKSHCYVPSTPSAGTSATTSRGRMVEHRNSTPAIHLKAGITYQLPTNISNTSPGSR